MRANIDADIFTYSFGSCTDDFGNPLAWPLVATRLNAQIANIVEAVGADSYGLYLTGSSNFRVPLASIRPYKGNRKGERPYWYQQVRSYLTKFRGAVVYEGWEADDQLAMDQSNSTVLCSLDKDLDMVPKLHYNWTKDKTYEVTILDGLRNFYCQLLTGDAVDNIPGLFGVGKSSTLLKRVRSLSCELNIFGVVADAYKQRFGAYWWPFLVENAQLLWMVTEERCDPEKQIVERLEPLRDRLSGLNWSNELQSSLHS